MLGGSVTGYSKDLSATWQVIAEGSDSRAAIYNNAENGVYDIFYDSAVYPDGYRYRNRALGHSLDNDARLYSVKVMFTDDRNRSLYAAYHRAMLNRNGIRGGNTVSGSAENINIGQIGLMLPWDKSMVRFDLTVQDDKPDTPGSKETSFSALASWNALF